MVASLERRADPPEETEPEAEDLGWEYWAIWVRGTTIPHSLVTEWVRGAAGAGTAQAER